MTMTNLEQQVEAMMRFCTACDNTAQDNAREELNLLLQGRKTTTAQPDPELLTRDLLLELGSPEHLLGHDYVVQAVLLVVHDRTYIKNITSGLYPQLATQFSTTPARVERAIRHLVEVTWDRGDLTILNRRFGNTVNPKKGKPTNGEFIARLANLVTLRMRA